MDTAIFVASVLGPFLAIMGLWMLLYGDNVIKIMTSMRNSPVALYTSAVFSLFLGIIVINLYNEWRWGISLFITLLGWVLFLRGVIGLFMPQLLVKAQMTNTTWIKTMGLIPFIWGLILCWIGFYM